MTDEGKKLLKRLDDLLKYIDDLPTYGQKGELKTNKDGSVVIQAGAKPVAKQPAAKPKEQKKQQPAKKKQSPKKKQQQSPPKAKKQQAASSKKPVAQKPKEDATPPKKQQQQGKKQKKKQKQKQKKPQAPAAALDDVSMCDQFEFRVGKVIEVGDHENADSIYVEKIDFGEDEPRQVLSGLKKFVTPEEFNNSLVIGFTNLKPGNIRGIKSYAMVMCAKSEDGSVVELMRPPAGAQVGDRLYLEGQDPTTQGEGQPNMNIRKKNSIWNKGFSAGLRTTANKEMAFNGRAFVCGAGKMVSATLPNAIIS